MVLDLRRVNTFFMQNSTQNVGSDRIEKVFTICKYKKLEKNMLTSCNKINRIG